MTARRYPRERDRIRIPATGVAILVFAAASLFVLAIVIGSLVAR